MDVRSNSAQNEQAQSTPSVQTKAEQTNKQTQSAGVWKQEKTASKMAPAINTKRARGAPRWKRMTNKNHTHTLPVSCEIRDKAKLNTQPLFSRTSGTWKANSVNAMKKKKQFAGKAVMKKNKKNKEAHRNANSPQAQAQFVSRQTKQWVKRCLNAHTLVLNTHTTRKNMFKGLKIPRDFLSFIFVFSLLISPTPPVGAAGQRWGVPTCHRI